MRFCPDGYSETAQAILTIARRKWPEHWHGDAIPADEREHFWDVLNQPKGLSGLVLRHELIEYSRAHQTSLSFQRSCDFGDASLVLQKALFQGAAAACFFDEFGQKQLVDHRCWATTAGIEALLTSVADESPAYDSASLFNRLILIPQSDIDAIEPATVEATPASTSEAQCRRELEEMMGAAPEQPRRRDDVFAEMKARRPGLSGRRFKAIWSEAAASRAPAWSRAGRREKSKH